jgi:hypothetical protein
VDRLLARRPSARGGFEYLVAWVGYGTNGDTWQHQDDILDQALIKAFDASYDLRIMLVWRRLRTFFYDVLTESKEAEFEKMYTFDSTIDPATAHGLLKLLAWQRGGAKPLQIVSTVVGKLRRTQLAVMDMQTVSDIVALHVDHPEKGLGALRIRFGSTRDKNPRVVGFPLLFTYWEPLQVDGRELEQGYKLTVTLATWTFLNPTGHHDHPPAQNEKKLNNSKRGRIVEHVKMLIKEPAATMASWPNGVVRRHGLSRPPQPGVPAWADLPASRWELTKEECMPSAAV